MFFAVAANFDYFLPLIRVKSATTAEKAARNPSLRSISVKADYFAMRNQNFEITKRRRRINSFVTTLVNSWLFGFRFRIFKLTPLSVQENINLLQASVLSMVEFDDDIFAAGHCFDFNQYVGKPNKLYCPFAHRLPPPEIASLAKDLASEYHYLSNTSEWFFLARKTAERIIAKNEQYIKGN